MMAAAVARSGLANGSRERAPDDRLRAIRPSLLVSWMADYAIANPPLDRG